MNRVMLAETSDELDALVSLFRDRGVPCRVDIAPYQANESVLLRLHELNFRLTDFETALYHDCPVAQAPQCDVRLAVTYEQRDFAARSLPIAFGDTDETWIRWLQDSMWATMGRSDWRTYVAYRDGTPAAFAQLHIRGTTACLALAGTLSEHRSQGFQTALIRQRLTDAAMAGCDLVCAQAGFGTTSQQNMERAGFRVAYTKAVFSEAVA
jgi:GNAT superfamily N-acetyltransferase